MRLDVANANGRRHWVYPSIGAGIELVAQWQRADRRACQRCLSQALS